MANPRPASGQELYEQILINTERNTAKALGNFERLQKWQEVKFFPAARKEWLRSCRLFAKRHGLESFLSIQSGKATKRQVIEDFILTSLRLGCAPDGVLKKHAALICNAASEGDVEFFREIGKALRAGRRGRTDRGFLAFNVLRYWFAGLLWLMNEKAGVDALSAYTGSHITKHAYRKACQRLKLQGYKDRMRSPPVRRYDPRTRSYNYAASWTYLEPNLST